MGSIDFTGLFTIFMLNTANFVTAKNYSLKNEDAETSPFPKLPLEKHKQIVYNHLRSNQRIFAVSDGCHRKLNNGDFKLNRLSPIAVGDGQFIFYGDCRDM